MRLIDADALIKHFDDIALTNIPNDNDSLYERDRKFAVLDGLGMAEAAVRNAPTANVCDRGKYKPVKLKPPNDMFLNPTIYLCGFCKKITHGKYCSNCGCENDWSDYFSARATVSKEIYEAMDYLIKQMKERRHDTDTEDSPIPE